MARFGLLAACAAALVAHSGAAQSARFQTLPNGLRWGVFTVPGCRHQAALLFVGAGGHEDPVGTSGLAHLVARLSVAPSLAEEQKALTGPRRPPETPTRANVLRARCTLFSSLEPVGAERETLRWFADILRDLPEDQDRFDRERLGLITAVHEATEVEPGGALWWRALRSCHGAGGRPWIGDPKELESATLAQARAWHRVGYAPARALLVLVGELTEADALPLLGGTLGELPRRNGPAVPAAVPPAVPPTVPPATRPAAASQSVPGPIVSPHVGAPFVTAAFPAPAPDAAGFAAFVVALAALESRVHAAFAAVGRDGMTGFESRGLELVGDFPPVRCKWLEGDAVLCLNRRGRNGQPPDAVRAELETLLTNVAQEGFSEAEIRAARLARNLVPAWPPSKPQADLLQRFPRGLFTLGHALGMAEVLGLPADLRSAIDAVPAAAVQAQAKSWSPAKAAWLSLVPP